MTQALAWLGLALVPLGGVALARWWGGRATEGAVVAEQWAIRVTWRDGGEAWATDTHDPRRVLVFDTEADADRRCVWLWQTRGALEVAALDVVPYVEGGRTDGD